MIDLFPVCPTRGRWCGWGVSRAVPDNTPQKKVDPPPRLTDDAGGFDSAPSDRDKAETPAAKPLKKDKVFTVFE